MLEGTYAIGYWCSEAYAGNEEQINNVLNTMLAELESHRLFLARLNESGGASELIIAIFMGEMSGAGVRGCATWKLRNGQFPFLCVRSVRM